MNFKKGALTNSLEYPITKEQIRKLQACILVNPRIGVNHKLKPFDYSKQKEYADEILQVRLELGKGIYPKWFMDIYYPFKDTLSPEKITQPLSNEGLSFDNPALLAKAVHMDSPSDAPKACLSWLIDDGGQLKNQETKFIDFLGAIPDVEENITDGIKRALHKGFNEKYYHGVARPEEFLANSNNIVPSFLTAYPEGCPNHPSYPAGHGCAVAGGISRLMNHFELNDYQRRELLDTAFLWAMFRSLAGVHYGVDNVAGLAIGGLSKYFTKEAKEKYLK